MLGFTDKIDSLQSELNIDDMDDSYRKKFIIEVTFKGSRKDYYSNSKAIPLKVGGHVIVDYDTGEDMGVVSAIIDHTVKRNIEVVGDVLRRSNEVDINRLKQNRVLEEDIFIDAKKDALRHELEMKFVEVEYKFDRKKLMFYFTADGRVDFRELVKTFAARYKTRIELRQIGVRDEAQLVGGVGMCGRELCCSKFLKNFVSINVSMGREQNLFVKPEKFSGVCGKLMCCLNYEHAYYKEAKKDMPEIGSFIQMNNGKANIIDFNIFTKIVTLEYVKGEVVSFEKEDFKKKLKRVIKSGADSRFSGMDISPCDQKEKCKSCKANQQSNKSHNYKGQNNQKKEYNKNSSDKVSHKNKTKFRYKKSNKVN